MRGTVITTAPTTTTASSTQEHVAVWPQRDGDQLRHRLHRHRGRARSRRRNRRAANGDASSWATKVNGGRTPISRRAGTCTRASRSTTSAPCSPIAVPTSRATGIPSACASTTSTARWAGRASTRIVVVSAIHARQRDNYDEQNFLGTTRVRRTHGEPKQEADGRSRRRARGAAVLRPRHCKMLLRSGLPASTPTPANLARPDRAQRLSRRGHDDHQPLLRRLPPPRPLPAHLDGASTEPR